MALLNSNLNTKSLDTNDFLLMGLDFSSKPIKDLIQNNDLPPPQKLFSPSSMAETQRVEKMELLKALRLSQTRAREAEKRAKRLERERECVGRLFLDEARLMFCYRQLVKMMELRVLEVGRQWRKERERDCGDLEGEREEEDDEDGEVKFMWAVAIWLSVAGVGFVLGYRCFL